MDLNKLEKDIHSLVENLNQDEFIYDFLLAYDFPKATITRLKKGDYNKSKNADADNANNQEILWKKYLFFKVEQNQDLHLAIDEAQKDPAILKQHPRFIIVTDFDRLLAVDTKIGDSLDIALGELSENYTFFLPWAGMEKTQIQSLNLADIKAAEKLAQLYDIIIQENQIETDTERHGLNIFLSRLLFCFFAEDTGIFEEDQFTNAIASHTQDDGSDLQDYLIALFKVMNIEKRSTEPQHVKDFPYVNGGLFAVDYPAPKLNAKARKMIIDAGTLNWKQINPDIFGSMMQAVVHSDQRGSLGMHYTSVANIMKVIEPLFLNDLKTQLDKAGESKPKLIKLRERLYNLRLFDPACGSGNFLIIAYKELCRIEIEILKHLDDGQMSLSEEFVGRIKLTQFYGIELDDFAHETAKLSLWLAEHQMNLEFKSVFGSAKPTLPLQDGGHIVCGNATRLDWEDVCPKEDGAEIYIMGNPPYLGFSMQTKDQKNDLKYVWGKASKLDYISCWLYLAKQYIQNFNSSFSFVSTNSICQGEQVTLLWPHILNENIEIHFCHTSFKWTNSAKGNAGVTCIVIGVANKNIAKKHIYENGSIREVDHINAYLTSGKDYFIKKRSNPLSNISAMTLGDMAKDGGYLILSTHEKSEIIDKYPESKKFIRALIGAQEFIRGGQRWCLWIKESDLVEVKKIQPIKERIESTALSRLKSTKKATQNFSEQPYRFVEIRKQEVISLFIPTVSSERREYIPIGFNDPNDIITAPNQVIYNPDPHIFAIISSRIHMTWVRAVAGRLKTDYRYSSALCYNTFPFPEISEAQKTTLEDHVFNVLDEREKHPEKTMAELYDPDKMPEGLRQAHHEMDVAVEQCYRKQAFKSDEERLEYLFRLYEEMIEAEES